MKNIVRNTEKSKTKISVNEKIPSTINNENECNEYDNYPFNTMNILVQNNDEFILPKIIIKRLSKNQNLINYKIAFPTKDEEQFLVGLIFF